MITLRRERTLAALRAEKLNNNYNPSRILPTEPTLFYNLNDFNNLIAQDCKLRIDDYLFITL